MKLIPDFNILFGDLLDGIFEAITSFFAAILAAIGELFVMVCESVMGSDNLVVVIPSGLVGAVVLGSGVRLIAGGGAAALISVATLVIIGILFLFFMLGILLAVSRRKKRH